MWDRLLTDCRVATMEPEPGNPLGIIENGAIGIQDGRIVRVGTRTELAGHRAQEVTPLDGAWVTPGLIDCHTHLIFGGNRADEHAMRRAGLPYEEIAKAGGGIASTVKATREASENQLLAAAAMRLDALISGGVTTIEIKSGYGLDRRRRDSTPPMRGCPGGQRGGPDRSDFARSPCSPSPVEGAPR